MALILKNPEIVLLKFNIMMLVHFVSLVHYIINTISVIYASCIKFILYNNNLITKCTFLNIICLNT